MRSIFRQPDITITSADGSVDCALRLEECQRNVGLSSTRRYDSMTELRSELDTVREFLESHPELGACDLGPDDVTELAARLHQLLIGQVDGELNPAQRQVYGVTQSRFTIRRER